MYSGCIFLDGAVDVHGRGLIRYPVVLRPACLEEYVPVLAAALGRGARNEAAEQEESGAKDDAEGEVYGSGSGTGTGSGCSDGCSW